MEVLLFIITSLMEDFLWKCYYLYFLLINIFDFNKEWLAK